MNDTFIYIVGLPAGVSEMVTPCLDGYTIYINERLCDKKRREAYIHAIKHINNHDFERYDVQEIEGECHAKS